MSHSSDRQDALDWISEQEQILSETPPSLVFSPEEYSDRQARVRTAMARERVDVLIVTAPDSTCWMHGFDSRWYRSHSSSSFPSTHCTLMRTDVDEVTFIETAAHEHLVRMSSTAQVFLPVPGSSAEVEPTLEEFVEFVAKQISGIPSVRVVGVERWSSVPSPAVLLALESRLEALGIQMVDATHLLRAARRIKSPAEIALIEKAQSACDAGVLALQAGVRAGMTELEAWALYMSASVAAGGEPTAMHETVAAGAPMPHIHRPSSRSQLQVGDYFHPDMASAVHRYHARATRTLCIGPPAKAIVELSSVIAGAFDVLVEIATVGTSFGTVNKEMRRYFAACGIDGWAGGYELGVSFPPDWVGEFTWSIMEEDSTAIVEPGLVTNFESIAFLAMVDTVVFEDSGARFLSSLPREALVCTGEGS